MAKALTKSQIATEIATKNNLSKKAAVEILEIIADLAYKNAKNSFTLPGLGKLVLVNRKARMGRNPATGAEIICVYNFSAVTIESYRLGLPRAGKYKPLLNSDAESYGGAQKGRAKQIAAEAIPNHGLEYSAAITLPPLAGIWFEAPVKREKK